MGYLNRHVAARPIADAVLAVDDHAWRERRLHRWRGRNGGGPPVVSARRHPRRHQRERGRRLRRGRRLCGRPRRRAHRAGRGIADATDEPRRRRGCGGSADPRSNRRRHLHTRRRPGAMVPACFSRHAATRVEAPPATGAADHLPHRRQHFGRIRLLRVPRRRAAPARVRPPGRGRARAAARSTHPPAQPGEGRIDCRRRVVGHLANRRGEAGPRHRRLRHERRLLRGCGRVRRERLDADAARA